MKDFFKRFWEKFKKPKVWIPVSSVVAVVTAASIVLAIIFGGGITVIKNRIPRVIEPQQNIEDLPGGNDPDSDIIPEDDISYDDDGYIDDEKYIIVDTNDYKDIVKGNEMLKLTVKNKESESKDLRIGISDEGKGYTFKEGDCLEYDVMLNGLPNGCGGIDLIASGGSKMLSTSKTAYDMNGIKAIPSATSNFWGTPDENNLSMFAGNRWYHRKIKIPQDLIGKQLYRWDILSRHAAIGVEYSLYYDNIRLTDGNGNIKYVAYSGGKLSFQKTMTKTGIESFSLDPEYYYNANVMPKGDGFKLMVTNNSLSSSQKAKIDYKFSTEGSKKYKLKAGDSIVYKVRNGQGFLSGTGAVDIKFTDGSSLTDYSLLDASGYSIRPENDISGVSLSGWYYRKIDIKGAAVGKTIDYWSVKTENVLSEQSFTVYFADIKIINNEKTKVLAYGGGSIANAELVKGENASADLLRHHSASNVGKPSGDVIKYVAAFPSTSGRSYTKFADDNYVINKGDFLEYDVKSSDFENFSGFGIDLYLGDLNPSYSGWQDQNGIAGTVGSDVSVYSANTWYHRKISLSNLQGETIKEYILGVETKAASRYAEGYIDNVKITNLGKTVKNVYTDGPVKNTQVVKKLNTSTEALGVVPLNKDPINQVVSTNFATTDFPVISYNVKDFGAKGDGKTDDTVAFQSAIFKAQDIGGGTVFVPSGKYRINGNLFIPGKVTLRGDWRSPLSGGGKGEGTVLLAYAGKGQEIGTPFIALGASGAVTNISVHYPEQSSTNVIAYPWTVQCIEGNGAAMENLTIYNPFRAIKLGPYINQLETMQNIFATPLSRGIEGDCNFDIPRAFTVHFTPDIWAQSGLQSVNLASLRTYMNNNCVGIGIGRIDMMNMYDIHLSYMKTGIRLTEAKTLIPDSITEGGAFSTVNKLYIDNAQTGINIEVVSGIGFAVSDAVISASGGSNPVAIRTTESFTEYAAFNKVTLSSTGNVVEMNGAGRVSIQNSTFNSWGNMAIAVNKGSLMANGNNFKKSATAIALSKDAKGATILSNTYAKPSGAVIDNTVGSAKANVTVKTEAIPYTDFGNLATSALNVNPKPKTTKVFDVKKAPYNAKSDSVSDDGPAIRKALSDAAAAGGGTVYLPGGRYKVLGTLTVPAGVELRGIYTTSHHTIAAGSVLQVYEGYNNENGAPFITLKEGAGINGIDFHYPEQLSFKIVPFPYLVKGDGKGVYVKNVSFINVYKGIDFSKNCDNHYISRLWGVILKEGMFIGDSPTSGTIENIHFNPHFWYNFRAYGTLPQTPDVFADLTYLQQVDNATAAVFGDCANEKVFSFFTWTTKTGMKFIDQGKGGTSGNFNLNIIDGSMHNIIVDKAKTLNFVTPYFYAHHRANHPEREYVIMNEGCGATVNMWNVMGGYNTLPTEAFHVKDGMLNMQQGSLSSGSEAYNFKFSGGKSVIDSLWVQLPTQVWGPVAAPIDIGVSGTADLTLRGFIVMGTPYLKSISGANSKFNEYAALDWNR